MKSKGSAAGKSDSPAVLACGLKLRTVRMDREIGLRRLADKLGLCAATLSAWELGQRVPDPDGVARVLGFLQVKTVEFNRILELCRGVSDLNLVEIPIVDTAPLLWTYERIVAGFTEWAPRVVPELLQT